MSEKRIVTIYDVAAAAGVSIATVNRALNNKPRISETTRTRVIKTAAELGYTANKAAQALSRKAIKIGIIICDTIPEVQQGVLSGMRRAIAELSTLNVFCEIYIVEKDKKNGFLGYKKGFDKFRRAKVNGIIIFTGDEQPKQREEIDSLSKDGILTATIVTDIPKSKRILSVRCNGFCEGQMAAEILAMLIPNGKAAIFGSSADIAICAENIAGFKKGCANFGLSMGPVFENHDDPKLAYLAVDKLVESYPDIGGIYICSANSDSVCRRIEELGLFGKYKIISTDLFEGVSHNIEKGIIDATLFQNLEKQGEVVVKTFYKMLCGELSDDPREILFIPEVIMKSNKNFVIERTNKENAIDKEARF